MERLFNVDSKLFLFINKIVDLVILNLLFLITSLPIITIGASLKALCETALRLVNNTESYIVRNYFTAWKNAFKRSTVLWIFVLISACICGADLKILPLMPYTTIKLCLAAIQFTILFLLYGIMLFYNFISDTYFQNFSQTLKIALFLSLKYLPYTLLCICITMLPFTLAILFPQINQWILSCFVTIGFSSTAYLHALIVNKVIVKIKFSNPS